MSKFNKIIESAFYRPAIIAFTIITIAAAAAVLTILENL